MALGELMGINRFIIYLLNYFISGIWDSPNLHIAYNLVRGREK